MPRILSAFNSLKLQHKLTFSFTVLIVLPIVTLSYLSYEYFSYHYRAQAHDMALQIIHGHKENIGYNTNFISSIFNKIHYNRTLQGYFSVQDEEFIKEYEAVVKAQELMDSFLEGTNDFMVVVYTENPLIPENYALAYDSNRLRDFVMPVRKTSIPSNIVSVNRIREEAWYKQAMNTTDHISWAQVGSDKEQNRISAVSRYYNFNTFMPLGLLRISVPLESVFGLVVSDRGFPWSVLITDRHGNSLFSNADADQFFAANEAALEWQSDTVRTAIVRGKPFLFVNDNLPTIRGSIRGYMSLSEISSASREIGRLTLIVSMITVLLLTILAYYISRSLTRRISRLSGVMRNAVRSEAFHSYMDVKHNDEIGYLIQSYNYMMSRITSLINEVYVERLRKKETDLRLLQAQVNPHFLFNTLANIESEAHEKGAEEAARMIRDLSRFYRLSLSGGKDIITLREELELVKSYIGIQQIRFDDLIVFIVDVDPAIQDYLVPKLIIQPFLENVYVHGIDQRRNHVTVWITATTTEDGIRITIADDGAGMGEEMLRAIRERVPIPNKSGYGIKNVDERIKMLYGEHCEIEIESKLGEGTTVTLIMPVRHIDEPLSVQ